MPKLQIADRWLERRFETHYTDSVAQHIAGEARELSKLEEMAAFYRYLPPVKQHFQSIGRLQHYPESLRGAVEHGRAFADSLPRRPTDEEIASAFRETYESPDEFAADYLASFELFPHRTPHLNHLLSVHNQLMPKVFRAVLGGLYE